MTNAEKYLKDGVDIKQMATEMVDYFNFPPYEGIGEGSIEEFFDKEVKPALTEDEKVILRNIDTKTAQNGFGKIKRNENGDIVLVAYGRANFNIHVFNHLFQFIKNGEEYSIEELLKGE